MYSIHDEKHIIEMLEKHGHKKFRYTQIENAIYKNLITDFEKMETLPKDIRDLLRDNCFYTSLSIHSEVTSDDGQTTKFLFRTTDDKMIEAVIMRHRSGRNTLCVSSQAGCPMACSFCATGKLGLIRNLEFYEIIDQIMIANIVLKKEDKKIRNVVYMGMGEPMLNYENVRESIHIASAQKKLDLSNRRITISTCGIVPGILRLAEDFPQVSLAISLHAPNDEARKRIMPVENTYPIDVLMQALDDYVAKTNKRIFYEYIMIAGVTDRPEYAHELASLLKGKLAHVNFIPYNPGEGIMGNGFQPTSKIMIKKFQSTLEDAGIPSTVRHTMGDDIDAACGQLALKEEGKSLATEEGKSLSKLVEKHWKKD
ncbi:23S rRNA (adenine(2503)-C(2))-methyltransferase RlmN [Candidatus Gracilibacteria bacterium]|nr:23S rRNA (adenine(2503)-C(2))-methyltransferase RlmN [Candidatus Gracilibacteria bacterium]